MNVRYSFYKNSNTGELIKKQSFEGTKINFPDAYYKSDGTPFKDKPNLTGFVPISEKKFEREAK